MTPLRYRVIYSLSYYVIKIALFITFVIMFALSLYKVKPRTVRDIKTDYF